MAIEMEGLEFQIETKASNGVKGIDSLRESLGKLKTATKGGLGLSSSIKQLEKLGESLKSLDVSKMEGLGKALETISKVGEIKISGNVAKQIGNIADAMAKISLADVERLERMGAALRNMDGLSNVRIPKVTTPSTRADTSAPTATTGAVTSGMTEATSQVQQVSSAVEQATQKTSTLKSVLNGIGGVFQKGFSLGAGAMHKLGNALNTLKVNASKALTAVSGFAKSLGSKLAAKVKQSTSGLGKMFKSLQRIAMYRLIRTALSTLTKTMKEGINNFYEYSKLLGGTFAQSMNSMATNAKYLTNSLGAMAAPIINALAPAIDMICGKIVTLINLINMLIARLSGRATYTAAKKMATAYGGAAKSAAGSAKDAADKIKHYTHGLDELNIFQKPDEDSGGGGGGGSDFGSMFEELPIDDSAFAFFDKVKEAFENADWKSLGELVGDKVNEIFESIDYAKIGMTLGFGIDGALKTTHSFLNTVDFYSIGTHVSELLNNALAETDMSFVGRDVVRAVGSVLDLALGALGTLDWGQLTSKLSDLLIGAFDEGTEWFNGYDWSTMGTNLWTNIVDAISNIDWTGIARSLFTFLGTALRSYYEFLFSFFGSIGSAIKTWWDEDIKGQDWKESAGNLLRAIGEGWLDINKWISDNLVDPFCSALLGEDTWSDVKRAGAEIWANLVSEFNAFKDNPGEWLMAHFVNPFLQGLLDIEMPSFNVNVKDDSEVWWENVKTWWSGKVGYVQNFLTTVKNDSPTWWSNVKTWWSGAVGSLPVSVSIINAASTWWADVKKWWNEQVGTLTTKLEIKVPKIQVKWDVLKALGQEYRYPTGFDITWNAQGGILDGAQIFGMLGNNFLGGGEAGREAVLPLDTHTEWMDTLADKVRSGLPGEGSYTEFRRALDDFYSERVQPTMNQMASDVQRQANKKEQVAVHVGNRTITDAVTMQQNANGYRFAR